MGWIAAVAAASAVAATADSNRRHENDSVALSISLLVGTMIPLAMVLLFIFDGMFSLIILVGIISFTVFGVIIIWAIAVYNNKHSDDENIDHNSLDSQESYRNESDHKIPYLRDPEPSPTSNYCSECGRKL